MSELGLALWSIGLGIAIGLPISVLVINHLRHEPEKEECGDPLYDPRNTDCFVRVCMEHNPFGFDEPFCPTGRWKLRSCEYTGEKLLYVEHSAKDGKRYWVSESNVTFRYPANEVIFNCSSSEEM